MSDHVAKATRRVAKPSLANSIDGPQLYAGHQARLPDRKQASPANGPARARSASMRLLFLPMASATDFFDFEQGTRRHSYRRVSKTGSSP
jgi:hypothetical protein